MRVQIGFVWVGRGEKLEMGKSFNAMLEMVSGVRDLGMEACVTSWYAYRRTSFQTG